MSIDTQETVSNLHPQGKFDEALLLNQLTLMGIDLTGFDITNADPMNGAVEAGAWDEGIESRPLPWQE